MCVLFIHITLIHTRGNVQRIPSNSYKSDSKSGKLFPDFIEKDRLTCLIIALIMVHYICFDPFSFDNPVNNHMADNLSTPKHIVPE